MIKNQQDIQNSENEIDLRELFLAFWKQKVMIISMSLIAAILAGIFSVFILSPVYDTRLNIVISMPEIYNTRYGEYKLPITTNDQYINLITSNDVIINTIEDMGYNIDEISVEDIKERVAIGKVSSQTDVVQNSFDVTVSADDSDESLKLAQTLYDNYIEFLDVMTKERAISYYYNNFTINLRAQELLLKSTQEILRKNEELLAETPETINQKDAMKEIQGTNDFVVLENIINPNYTKVESDVILNKQTIITIEDAIRGYTENLAQLDNEKAAVDKYRETGKSVKLESSLIGVVETSVYLPSVPVAPSHKTSPSNSMNAAIGLVIGLMLGVMIAFVKEYWLKKD